MAKLFERKSTSLTISEFYDNYTSNKYRFDVTYQRKSGVWSEDKKSFLIDSILKNYPAATDRRSYSTAKKIFSAAVNVARGCANAKQREVHYTDSGELCQLKIYPERTVFAGKTGERAGRKRKRFSLLILE